MKAPASVRLEAFQPPFPISKQLVHSGCSVRLIIEHFRCNAHKLDTTCSWNGFANQSPYSALAVQWRAQHLALRKMRVYPRWFHQMIFEFEIVLVYHLTCMISHKPCNRVFHATSLRLISPEFPAVVEQWTSFQCRKHPHVQDITNLPGFGKFLRRLFIIATQFGPVTRYVSDHSPLHISINTYTNKNPWFIHNNVQKTATFQTSLCSTPLYILPDGRPFHQIWISQSANYICCPPFTFSLLWYVPWNWA